MAKIQYPNPKFWKAKDDINWKKQGENLMEVMGIFGGMLMETDWQAVGKSLVDGLKADGARIKSEYEDFMALDPAEKWDRVINGERSLGRLYRKAPWPPCAASGAASRIPRTTSGSGRACGACCS